MNPRLGEGVLYRRPDGTQSPATVYGAPNERGGISAIARRSSAAARWGYWDGDEFTPWDQHPYKAEFDAALAARRAS